MAKGFSQVEGVDYEDIFSHVVKYSSIITILELVVQMGWKIHQMDVKTVKRCTLRNHKALRCMGESLICVGLRKPYMD